MLSSNLELISLEHGAIKLTVTEKPEVGMILYEGHGAFGSILIKEITDLHYTILHSTYKLKQDLHLSMRFPDDQLLALLFTTKGKIQYQFPDLPKGIISQHQYNMLFPFDQCQNSCKKGNISFVGIHLRPSFIERWTDLSQELGPFLEDIAAHRPSTMSQKSLPATSQMVLLINEIVHASHRGLLSMYRYGKIVDLLRICMEEKNVEPAQKLIMLTGKDKGKIERVMDYISNNIQKPGSIIELAKRFDINEFKLKKGFRQVFGTSIRAHVLTLRMEKARSLLIETDLPISKISEMSGYSRTNAFSMIFKKTYGYSPRALRSGLATPS